MDNRSVSVSNRLKLDLLSVHELEALYKPRTVLVPENNPTCQAKHIFFSLSFFYFKETKKNWGRRRTTFPVNQKIAISSESPFPNNICKNIGVAAHKM